MSQATSPSTGQPYGLARVCRVWGLARSTIYWQRHEHTRPDARRGPPWAPVRMTSWWTTSGASWKHPPSQAKATAKYGPGCGRAASARRRAASCA